MMKLIVVRVFLLVLVAACTPRPESQDPTSPGLPLIPEITPILPGQQPSPASPPAASPAPTSTATAPTDHLTIHVVEPGDTLLALARQYQVPMAAIQRENGLGDSTVVRSGRRLVIPSGRGWEGASPFWVIHEVSSSETLSGIARAYGLDLEALRSVNGLDDADRIAIGQYLILPLTGPVNPADGATPGNHQPRSSPTPTSRSLPTPSGGLSPTEASTGGAVGTADPVPATAEPAPSTEADFLAWPEALAGQINLVRKEHGLPAFEYNVTLAQAAQSHANDCATRGWCSHTGSDGADIRARIVRWGYDPAGWAECWAQTQSPAKAVEIWMDERPPNDPHRRTLLSDWLNEIGIGVSEADWGFYIIADFARP